MRDDARATLGARQRGRPRKPEADKLLPITTNLCQADFDALCALAKAQRVPVAETLRSLARVSLATHRR